MVLLLTVSSIISCCNPRPPNIFFLFIFGSSFSLNGGHLLCGLLSVLVVEEWV